VQQKSTLYITYNLTELEGVGGVVAAILAGLMRNHMAEGQNLPLLVAIDEMGAVRLRHLDTYLATVRGYGITMLLYAQSMSQLTGLYGRGEAAAILSNCAHQLWYPANDYQTAQYVSDLYGTTLKPNRSFSTTKRQERQEGGNLVTISQPSVSESLIESPTYSPTEVMGLPKGQVIVLTEQEQQYRFIGQRLDSREFFKQLPRPPQPPSLPRALRHYTPWLAQPEQLVTQPSETVPKDSLSATTSSSHAAPTTSTPPADTTNSPATDETAVGDTSDIVPKADIPPTKPAKKGQDEEFI
jgi:type IV secretory pathway TraG/TraD family ATPase VirD4